MKGPPNCGRPIHFSGFIMILLKKHLNPLPVVNYHMVQNNCPICQLESKPLVFRKI